MLRRPPRATRHETLFPSTRLFRPVIEDVPADATDDEPVDASSNGRRPGRLSIERIAMPSMNGDTPALFELPADDEAHVDEDERSEEHTPALQSLMRKSYAVFCMKKQKQIRAHTPQPPHNNQI